MRTPTLSGTASGDERPQRADAGYKAIKKIILDFPIHTQPRASDFLVARTPLRSSKSLALQGTIGDEPKIEEAKQF